MNKSSIPNIMTFGNLVCGILSIQYTMLGNFKVAGVLILLAGVLDRYDGTVARFLKVSSELGKELDSLADLVSFGVAPSILAFSLYKFHNLGIIGFILLVLFPVSGAFRLARYNCSDFNNVFTGVPITIAGSLMAIIVLLTETKHVPQVFPIVMVILLSYLMISKYQIKKR